jgi:hypothetical protein
MVWELKEKNAVCIPKCHQHLPLYPEFLSHIVTADEMGLSLYSSIEGCKNRVETHKHPNQKEVQDFVVCQGVFDSIFS